MAKKKFRSNKYWWVTVREKIVFLFLLALLFLVTPQKEYRQIVVAAFPDFVQVNQAPLPLPTPAPYPVNSTGVLPPDSVTAHAVSIIDATSGVTLYRKNDEELLAPASTTKLMTAMVALDSYKPDDIVTVKEATLSGQIMDLVPGEQITVEYLLYGLLIPSANDAAYVLAQHHPQGPQGFINHMNNKARELSLTQTNFTNPAGFDDDSHKMTAKDLVRLSRYALQYPLIAKIVATPTITVSDITYTIFHPLRSTNLLLGKIAGVAGIKTGSTPQAGENLITLIERDGRKIIIVILKSSDRFSDTEKLIEWVFKHHQWVNYGL